MYLPDERIEKSVLRQGDILSGTLILSATNLNAVNFIVDSEGKRLGWTVLNEPQFGAAMVISHSCEIDPGNVGKIQTIILARLAKLSSTVPPDRVESLKQSNNLTTDSTSGFLRYFWLEPDSRMPEFPDGAVVDFSRCFSVRQQSYDLLLGKKRIQLEEETVNALSFKLSLYFYREGRNAVGVQGADSQA